MNFKTIGVDNLQASRAFKQIRAHSRTYTTNLTHSISPISAKYAKLNSLFTNDASLLNSTSFGLKRAATLTSSAASTSINSTFLDKQSMQKFLDYNLQYNSKKVGTELFNSSSELWSKSNNTNLSTDSLSTFNSLLDSSKRYNSDNLKFLTLYPNVVKEMGDDSDKKAINYPFRKLLKKSFVNSYKNRLQNSDTILNRTNLRDHSSTPHSYINTTIGNLPKTSKEFMVQYSYQSQPFSKQSVRKYENLSSYTTNYNLSDGLNPADSNISRESKASSFITPLAKYNSSKTN
jgi:hypothetical protein